MTDIKAPDSPGENAIAVIGMAGRFPGADSVSRFWDNLCRGEESIVTLSEEALSASGIGARTLENPAYVRRAALVEGIEEFDAEFFGMTPYAARMMDPQQRLFLQTAWHAFEDAGYDPVDFDGAIGVFGTSSVSGYLLYNLMSHRDPKAIIGEGATVEMINLSLQNDKDHLATHVSHQFNLRGPSLSVQTACSSSLVAVHLACQSLLSGESDMALAGASSIRVPHRVGYWHEPGSMVSAVGHCRPFDVRADGTVFGSGVAAVLLKPLDAALADGDRIHAVIRGTAINNDGSVKMNYAAPNAAGQAEVIAEAHAVAGVDASTIGFVETHGTGTPLGDPVEIEGLRKAFAVSEATRTGPCVLGSVKSNIGHLEVASGITGLVKAILCLENKAIPPTLHFTAPNPELHLERTPFVVTNTHAAWESDGPRRAGVSSFGVGGTNVHVVLEEAPAVAPADEPAGPQVLLLSARSADAIADARAALAGELSRTDGPGAVGLADVAFTLSTRRPEEFRMAAVVRDRGDAAAVLAAAEDGNVFLGHLPQGVSPGAERIAFLFPGQGAQHVGMARGLYDTEPVFRQTFDACAAIFDAELGIDLAGEVFAGAGLESTDLAQPALFAVEYALAQLIMSFGVTPSVLAGHSIGELVAATVAGVFDLETACTVVSLRARLMHAAPAGAMVAVAARPEDIAGHLGAEVDVAAINDPGSCVVAGPEDAIAELTERLGAQGILARRVRTSHAFHSKSMDEVLPAFADYLATLTLQPPRIPMLSNLTGTLMTDQEATDPGRWASHIRSTVRFADELQELLGDADRVLVEVGPGGSLTGSAVRLPGWGEGHRAVRLMRHPLQDRDDRDTFLLALGQLWAAGIEVDWSPRHGRSPRRVTLPGYPFARERHWIEVADLHRAVSQPGAAGAAAAVSDTAEAGAPAADPRAEMQATLQRIWSQCLGVESVKPGDNFFEIGGDSLLAIGVAMTANHEGVDLTPQDLYDHHSLSALAETLLARYAAGGLTADVSADLAVPAPPSILRFLDTGLAERGRWRVPLVLRLDSKVSAADVAAAVGAVVNHHDALRMRVIQRAGSWEQQIAEPAEFTEPPRRSLPPTAAPGGDEEREALSAIVTETLDEQDLASMPLTATYVTDASGAARYLVLTLHQMADDAVSREVLLTDLLTAFAQRLAGQDIALEPSTTPWREYSQRCAALAAHPAVLDRRDYWLETAGTASLRVADPDVTTPPGAADLVRLSSALTLEQTSMIDNARRLLQAGVDEIMLAALARVLGTEIGPGVVAVDLLGAGRSVLKPDVDLRRTIGWFSTVYPVALPCVDPPGAGATELLEQVGEIARAVPHHGIGYGLLRYLHAPTARSLETIPAPDIHLTNLGMVPEWQDSDAPVRWDTDSARAVRETLPGLGHAVEIRVYRLGGVIHIDWWYDRRRVGQTVAELLAQRFPAALVGLVEEAVSGPAGADDGDDDDESLALVDLSAAVLDDD